MHTHENQHTHGRLAAHYLSSFFVFINKILCLPSRRPPPNHSPRPRHNDWGVAANNKKSARRNTDGQKTIIKKTPRFPHLSQGGTRKPTYTHVRASHLQTRWSEASRVPPKHTRPKTKAETPTSLVSSSGVVFLSRENKKQNLFLYVLLQCDDGTRDAILSPLSRAPLLLLHHTHSLNFLARSLARLVA